MTATVIVTDKALGRLKQGHLWIYRSDVAECSTASFGDVVRVRDPRQRTLGYAFYSDRSQIALRMVSAGDSPFTDELLFARIDAAFAWRRRFYGDALPEALRWVHAEGDDLPGLIVDGYGDVLVLQTTTQYMDQRKTQICSQLMQRLAPQAIVERNDIKVRDLEGLPRLTGVLRGEFDGRTIVREGAVLLALDLLLGQKTGSFLDQRENHIAAGQLVRPDDRCLDVFSYHGGFALQMASAGGRVSAVEISESAIAEASANAERNDLTVNWICANAFDWLKAQASDGTPQYDVIVLDPPAFAKSRNAKAAALRGYKEINLRALKLLAPGGLLVSCSCSYHVSEEELLGAIGAAAVDARRELQLIQRRGSGADHPMRVGVPETDYLKCLFFRCLR